MPSPLERVLEPDSIAIIGASKSEEKRGYRTIKNLQDGGYEGSIYPVNPKYANSQIRGLDVYPDISSVPEAVDLASTATPAETIPSILEEFGEAGGGGALVTAAGFGEIGRDDLKEELLEVARKYGIRIIGPNVLGFVNTHKNIDMGSGYEFPKGGIALLSQSGNFGAACSLKLSPGTGFSFFISVGNEDDIKFHEYIDHLVDHDGTEAIMMYVEGMSDARSFLQRAREVTKEKPIVVLKGGRTAAGKSSAQSHTASLAGDQQLIDAAYKQAGVIRESHMEELIFVTEALMGMPPMTRGNVGILTEGGGHATRAADIIADEPGLAVPDFSSKTQNELEELLLNSPRAPDSVSNPIDRGAYGASVESYVESARAVLGDSDMDALFICGLFGGYGGVALGPGLAEVEIEMAHDIAALVEQYDKPVVMQSEFADTDSEALRIVREAGVPVHTSLDTAVHGLSALLEYGIHLDTVDRKSDFVLSGTGEPSRTVDDTIDAKRTRLSEFETKQLLQERGAPVTPFELVTSAREAVDAANVFDVPVAMKISSRDIEHKTEAGGVALDVRGADEVEETYEALIANAEEYDPDAEIEGALVSPMVEDGTEYIIGVTRDEEIGHTLMFGLGGIFVEELEDVAFRALPLTEYDARGILDDIKAQGILNGARGHSPVDRDELVELILLISDLVASDPRIEELDVNPLRVTDDGVEILDASAHVATDDVSD